MTLKMFQKSWCFDTSAFDPCILFLTAKQFIKKTAVCATFAEVVVMKKVQTNFV